MVSYDRDHHHSNGNNSSGPSKESEPSAGFCRELFDLIRDLFNALNLSGRVSDDDSEEAFLAQNEAGRFRIWGSGFDVADGGLDELLDGSVLQGAVVVQFVGIARKLSRYVERDSDLFRYLTSTLEKAEYLFPEAVEDGDEDELDLLETLEDVSILNDGLYQLTPFLESIPIEYEENGEHQHPGLITTGTAEIKALYVNILDKWPSAEVNIALVDRLATLNGRRKKRIWELKEKHERAPPEPPSAGGGGLGYSPSSYAPSTRYTMGSSIASIPSSLQTLQDDRNYARSEASMSSLNSMDLAVVGVTTIPPPPVRLGPGVSFQCNLCFETLHGVETKYRWKKHVFKDLQPYSCSFLQCPLPVTHLFNSRTEWVNHEFDVHRSLPCWICITDCGLEFDDQHTFRDHLTAHLGTEIPDNELTEIVRKCGQRKPMPATQTTVCPLCRETIPETKRSISKHLGRHMEEISLAVVPTENYNLEWEESSEEGEASSTDEEGDGGIGHHLTMEARRRSTEIVASVLTTCFNRIHERYSKLLTSVDNPDWKKGVFSLVKTYDASGKCLDVMREDLLAEISIMLGDEPEIVGIRSAASSTEDYDLFLDQKIYDQVYYHLHTRQAAPAFQQCHNCEDVFTSSRRDCPNCGHNFCTHCGSAILAASMHSAVEGQLVGSVLPKLANRPPVPNDHIGPSSYTPDNLSHLSSPLQTKQSEPDAPDVVLYPPGPPDPPEITITPSPELQAKRPEPKPTAVAGSATGTDAGTSADVVTRSIVVDKKHYPRLIGAGGATLATIILESGGPVTKSAQSRVVRFPRSDSPSKRVVVTASLPVAEAIVERIKLMVAEFDGKGPKPNDPITPKDQVRERYERVEQMATQGRSPAISEADSRNASPSRPTISVGRAASQTAEIRGKGKAPVIRPSPEVKPWDDENIDGQYHQEPAPRTKGSRRRDRKKKGDSARREAEP